MKTYSAIVSMALALGLCVTASADPLPMPVSASSGEIPYISGGVGEDEAQQMKMEAQHYPLALQFLEQVNGVGTYSAGENVTIQDAGNRVVFNAITRGPFMLIDLPSGHYTVTASLNGREQMRNVDIGGGRHRAISFVWPASASEHVGGGQGEIDLSNS
jgi:hypothetical protein